MLKLEKIQYLRAVIAYNLVPICDKGPIKLATPGPIEVNCGVPIGTRDG